MSSWPLKPESEPYGRLRTFQASSQSGVKAWMMWVPSGQSPGSNRLGMLRKRVPRGASMVLQSSTRIW